VKFDTLESVRQLDEGLRKIDGIGPLHINLGQVWKVCTMRLHGEQLFPLVFDMQLHVVSLNIEMKSIAKRINSDIRESNVTDCLTNNVELEKRLDLFGDTTAFVLRYRAIWDKLMGAVILLVDPEEYQKFVKSRSRKKNFVKLLNERGGKWSLYAQGVSEVIETFDSLFRTAEAYGSGKLRKLVFDQISIDNNPLLDLFWANNSLNDQLLAFQKIFEHLAERSA